MVIGRGGSKIKELTDAIKEKFNVDNPQIEIEEAGGKASLNAQIMAEKLAEALERGWHFRRAGHSTVRRIMDAGAKGCQVIIAGKLTGARHRTEKFTEGHVKYCGETAREVMDTGYAIAKLKPGILGVKVRIMKPDAKLPDEITIHTPEAEKTMEKLRKELGGISGMILFQCPLRYLDALTHNLTDELFKAISIAPLIGLNSGGEYYGWLTMNQTLTLLALGESSKRK